MYRNCLGKNTRYKSQTYIIDQTKTQSVVGFGVGVEVALDELEKTRRLFFARLDVLFLDLQVTNGVVRAGALDD